jgi:hypothetical protein
MDGRKNGSRRETRSKEIVVGKRKNEKVKKITEERSKKETRDIVNPAQSFLYS